MLASTALRVQSPPYPLAAQTLEELGDSARNVANYHAVRAELALKLQRGSKAQPVIIVTAYGTPETMRELERAGVARCFPKPFPMDDLRRSVRMALTTASARVARRRAVSPKPAARRKVA